MAVVLSGMGGRGERQSMWDGDAGWRANGVYVGGVEQGGKR